MKLRIALLAALLSVGTANAQIITQWNFPFSFNTTSPAPSSGSGTAALVGGTTATSAAGYTEGGSTDTTGGTNPSDSTGNFSWNTATYPAASAASGTAGVRFNVSTAGQSNIVVRFDQRHSNTASRFQRLEYTTDGTNWTAAGVFETNIGATTWYNNRTVDLSGIAGANNNANFGIRIVSIFDPANNTSYTAAQPGSSYATNGTIRYDAVTVSAGSVWVGGSGTDLGTAANYAGGVAPTSTGTVLLGPAGGANTMVMTTGTGNMLDQLVIRAGAPLYTVSGTGTLTLNAGLINNATNTQMISAPVTFGQSNTIQNAGTLALDGPVNFTNYLNIQGGGTTTLSGTTSGSLGTLTTGNPAVPTIRVGSGTLTATGTLNTRVEVYSGSTLQGNGTIGGNVTVRPGGTIRGDSGTGTANLNMTTGVTTLFGAASNGANLATQLSVSSGTILFNSKLALTGASTNLNFDVTAGKFRITLLGDAGLTFGNTYTITLATANASTNFFRTQAGGNATDPFTTADFDLVSGSGTWTAFNSVALVRNGVNLDLTFSPVPEPATVGLVAAGMLSVVGAVRRKRRPTAEVVA